VNWTYFLRPFLLPGFVLDIFQPKCRTLHSFSYAVIRIECLTTSLYANIFYREYRHLICEWRWDEFIRWSRSPLCKNELIFLYSGVRNSQHNFLCRVVLISPIRPQANKRIRARFFVSTAKGRADK
jgi:hypothetical protein